VRLAVVQKGKSPDVPLETFSKVVEAVYDCALDPTRWQNAISLAAELCRSDACMIGVHDYANGRTDFAYNLGFEERCACMKKSTR
jgi:hypothetical protein